MKAVLKISTTKEDWITAAVDLIIDLANDAFTARGEFSLVLSGGSTPRPVYEELANRSGEVNWEHSFIFWGDERCVPPDHPESNYRMAKESLLDQIPIPDENIFRMLGEIDPQIAAQDYEGLLAAFFQNKEKRFDTVLLGIGEDGHTASLFPGTEALDETVKWVAANSHPSSDRSRLTLTYPALNAARQIIFLVAGGSKADVVTNVINNPEKKPAYPAKGIIGHDKAPIWILDTAAATNL
jgi:6-phosphogluconolactonase